MNKSKDHAKSQDESHAEQGSGSILLTEAVIVGLVGGITLFQHLYNSGVIPHLPPEIQEKILLNCVDVAFSAAKSGADKLPVLVAAANGALYAGAAWHPAIGVNAGFLDAFPSELMPGGGFVYAGNSKIKDGAYKQILGPGDQPMPVRDVIYTCPANITTQRKVIPR